MPDDPTLSDDFIDFMRRVEGGEEHRGEDGLWRPYKTDGAGKWTIGRGHLINGGLSPEGFDNGLTDEEVEQLFQDDLDDAIDTSRRVVGPRSFDHLPTRYRQLLTDFAFNLGPRFADEFPKMTRAVLAGQDDRVLAEVGRFRTLPSGEKRPLEDRNKQTKLFFFNTVVPDETN